MIPLSKFADLLRTFQQQANEDWEEIIMAANLLGDRPNYFTMDEHGQFHAQASGTLDECIRALEHHLSKLKKIKEQKENPH
jgi:hypothetical protein